MNVRNFREITKFGIILAERIAGYTALQHVSFVLDV